MIVNDAQADALRFVRAANIGGYRPTEHDIEEWRLRRDPLPGKRGRMISSGTPSPLAADWMQLSGVGELLRSNVVMMEGTVRNFLNVMGGTPARFEPDGPAESLIASLTRLGWLTRDEAGGHTVTALGLALLRADEATGDDSSQLTLLHEGDPLSYASLVGHVADVPDAFIVDPYLKSEQLFHLLQATSASRFLVGPGLTRGEVAAMQTLISGDAWGEGRELRQAARGELHDRYIIGTERVSTIGTSMNGVGKTTTYLMPMPDEAGNVIRDIMNGIWERASVLNLQIAAEIGPAENTAGNAPEPLDSGSARAKKPRKRAAKKASPQKQEAHDVPSAATAQSETGDTTSRPQAD